MITKRRNLDLGSSNYAHNIILDTLVAFVAIFIFVVVGLVSFNFFHDLKVELVDEDDGFLSNESKDIITNSYNTFPVWLDGIVITILVLFWIMLLGLTFVVDSHPIIWGIVLFLLIFMIFVAAILSNTYHELSLDEDLYVQAAQLQKTQWVMDRLPFILTIMIVSLIVAMLMKSGI